MKFESKCSYPACDNEAIITCIDCKRTYCKEHGRLHRTIYPNHTMTAVLTIEGEIKGE